MRLKLVDTDVIICAINPSDHDHEKASMHLEMVSRKPDYYVPSEVLLEVDLELRAHGYTHEERVVTLEDLLVKIPEDKVMPLTPGVLALAAELQASGLGYFDSLIVARAKLLNAVVVTRDREITRHVETVW